MNILIVSQCYYPDTFLINEIAPKMVEDGHNVTVVAGMPRNEEQHRKYLKERIKREMINGVEVVRCFDTISGDSSYKLALNYITFVVSSCWKMLWVKKDFDVVFCYQLSPITQACPAILYKKIHKKKLFLYCLDIFPESLKSHTSDRSIIFKITSWISKRIYRACDVIGVTSKSFIGYNEEINSVPSKKMIYIPQHADDSLMTLSIKKTHIGHTDFLFAGNIGYAQNLEVIIDAVALIGSEYDYTIHFVGDGSKLSELKKIVSEKKLENKIVFHGRQSRTEMRHFYEMSDVLLLTLRGNNRVGETIPGKLQTYMTAGRPIIASINGSASDIINEAKCGICVPASDTVGLSAAMRQYLAHPQLFEKCGCNSRKYYLENFTFEKYMKSVYDVLNSICKNT